MGAREEVNQRIRKKIGNEKSTRIWDDVWIQDCTGRKLTSLKPQDCKLDRVEEIISNFRWNTTLIFRTFRLDEAGKILKMPISLAGKPDSYFQSPVVQDNIQLELHMK